MLRRNVQRALSRGENYRQLRRAVTYANFGKLRFKMQHGQQINLHGPFEFRSSPEQIDIAAMVQELARYPIQSMPDP